MAMTPDEAERAVLGAMMLSSDAVSFALDALDVQDFAASRHQQTFAAISLLFANGQPIDAVTVRRQLEKEKSDVLPVVLLRWIEECPSSTAIAAYSRIVYEHAVLRRLEKFAVWLRDLATSAVDADAAYHQAEDALAQIQNDTKTRTAKMDQVASDALDVVEDIVNRTTPGLVQIGIGDLDDCLGGGLYPGHLIVVGARPSVGKSALAGNIAASAASRGQAVLFASAEMKPRDIVIRIARDIGRGRDNVLELARTISQIAEWPMWFLSTPITVAQIVSEARRVRPALVIVDYLQLLTGSKHENRVLEVGEYARQLKLLAERCDVPVLALSQLNRSPAAEKRRPVLSDLRDSGEIENHADEVIFLHRPDLESGEAEALVDKNRYGDTRMVELTFLAQRTRFVQRSRIG